MINSEADQIKSAKERAHKIFNTFHEEYMTNLSGRERSYTYTYLLANELLNLHDVYGDEKIAEQYLECIKADALLSFKETLKKNTN